ncbi:MAG: SDR family NAD(P)-dependent oxidoreductase, partial [Gammaproteobacteria bacterium]|nr:SDR family NAD(P)-dependent oxidoreductase [Gammaproteobacteria bacterium]
LHKPKDLSFESAATLPITFLTAWYTLHELAHIKAGETILIQAAAGGVGLSALQLAQQAGARVFATAGTGAKRDLLRNLGVEHVLDSRSLSFADEIMQLTGGRGVDIVLNSLAGEAIARGIACLAPYGRFLELGKRDIYQDSHIGLWPFRQNLSFYGIDLSRLLADRPEQIRQMLDILYRKLSDGSYHALPHRVFPLAAIRDAFGYMAKGRHTGKVVISMFNQPVQVQPRLPEHICFENHGSYLITGGLGGFGLVIAKWLISRGAKTLVLASRRGINNDAASQAVAELEALGAQVSVSQLDVSNADQVKTLLALIRQDMPPLRGIYHAAMVLDDETLAQLDEERFRRVMAPKVDGCWNLHQASLQDPLEQFVMFSSISAIVGTPGQAHYAAANGFLDAFVHYRRSKGLAGLSINWGRLGEVGVLSRNQPLEESLERRGFHSFSPTQATEALERLLLMDATQAIFGHMDWRKLSNGAPRFSRLDTIGNQADDEARQRGHIRTLILESPVEEQSGMLREYIRQRVGKVLGVAPDRLDLSGRLNEMGLDSLMAIELINQLENDLDVSFRSSEIMQQPTSQTLVELAMKQLEINDSGDDTPAVSQEDETGTQGCLVPLQKGSDNKPVLYCLHANDGKLDIYSGLADALPEALPLTGIRSAWLAGERSRRLSLDELISQYVEDIIRHQPAGPYHLAGFSYGGLLALLTAHRLEGRGAEVAFVALLDSNPAWVDPDVARVDILQDLLDEVLSNILADPETRDMTGLDLAALVNKLKTTEATRRSELIRTTLFGQLEVDQAIKILLDELIDSIEYHTSLVEEMTLPVVKAPIHAWETRSDVTDNYRPGDRWAAHSLTGSDDKVIDCGHWALMDTPNIQPIAKQLADLMQDDNRD